MKWIVLPVVAGLGLLAYLGRRTRSAVGSGPRCGRCKAAIHTFPAEPVWTRLSKCNGPEAHYAIAGTHLRYGEISIPLSASIGERATALSADRLEALFTDLDLFSGMDASSLEAELERRLCPPRPHGIPDE